MIGNCRNTHIDASGFNDVPDFLRVNLTIQDKDDDIAYKNFIVKKILGDVGRFFKVEEEFYQLRPAFAVFLRFLHEKYGKTKSDFDFRNFDSFRKWLKRRLVLTFKKDNFEQLFEHKELFYLFSILPSQFEITDNLCIKYNDHISTLKKDGWLEDDENVRANNNEFRNELRAIHDTIADEILIFRLEKYANSLKPEIRNIFDFAIENESFEKCFRAFERIADWQGFKDKKYIFHDMFFDIIKEQTEIFQNKERFITTARILSAFLVLIRLESGFGEKNEKIIPYIEEWLRRYGYRPEASFIFKAWLDAGGEKEFIKDYIRAWLKKYPEEMGTHFVIKAWLDAGGDKELVKNCVEAWLKKYREEMETSFVIQSWLDAGGAIESIEDYVKVWLKKFPEEMETSFVIKSWLDAGGEKEVVEEYVKEWLGRFQEDKRANRLLQAWLNAGGEKEFI